jgi:hypothetical protein
MKVQTCLTGYGQLLLVSISNKRTFQCRWAEVMGQSRLAPMLIVNAKIVMLKKNTITQ